MSKKNVEWEWKIFEECLDKINVPIKIPKNKYLEKGCYPIVSQEEELISGFCDNKEDLIIVNKPVVIFGDHTRNIKYIDFDFAVGADGVKILVPTENINSKFFYFFLKSVDIKNLGYARHYILLKELMLPIPPLDEQERIVKVLDDAFEKIDAIKTTAETNLQNAKDLFQTTLANEFVVSKENNLWTIHNLEDIVSEDCSISYGIVQPGEHIEDGIPVVRPIDLKEKNLDSVDPLKRTSKKISDAYKRTILQGGEILMCVRGTTGTVSIASDDFKNCNVTRGIVPFRFGTKTFSSFMYYAFVSSFVSNQIQEQTRGTALKQINIKDLKEIKIPLPPLPIQKQIVAKLDSLSEKVKQLESNYKQVLADCDELKKSILKKAFNGEL